MCIVQPQTPLTVCEDIAPIKQTIRNALRDPKSGRGMSQRYPLNLGSMTTQCQLTTQFKNASSKDQKQDKPKARLRLFRGRRVLGDSLGALRHGVLGKLTGQDQADRGLDFSGRDGGLLVVGSELGGLGGDALEDIVDEGVQDGHGTVGDTSVGVDLLEDLVDVGAVGLLAGLGALLLVARGSGLLAGILLLGSLGGGSRGLGGGLLVSSLGSHFEDMDVV
jgi:hypothetical protein